ncbi:Cadherin-related family member 5 [Larimichthys crocea]|uniref:Uncharacterized protein n=1 Tax=Larimichthys crocea TaxID=215358 RepID=A0ACD3QDW7_LARCR|nr:Cadherin-related family member 5 [Larimichthys crocea]
MSGWDGCLDGQDIFTTIKENSRSGEVIAELMADTTMEGVQWTLNGRDADWFYLDERHIRLNTSADKVLDREVQGSVLMADLTCYEEDTFQTAYRIVVEILNENDNSPMFAKNTVQSLIISELTPVNTVVFTVQAKDADNDMIVYLIDQTSEMNTAELFNTSTNITITVLDGDDQYPQFLPCMLLFQDKTSRICTSPVYTVNVTEGEEDIVLDFSPGPIHAVDGDRELCTPVKYAILSGDDDGRFLMDSETGEMKLIHGVFDRLTTPVLHLQVMAYQDDDPRKYSLATVLVQVLAVNQFYPEFAMAEYQGFVTAGKSPASLVNTYGSKVLVLHVHDQDFNHGFNPMIHFTLSPTSNHTDIYQITQEGLLITRTDQLKPGQKHVLEVAAIDQESGDATFATVVVDVLSEGQLIPYSPLGDGRITGCTVGKALFLSMVFMSVFGCILWLVMWLKKKHKGKRDSLERGCVAQGKHPNVSLRWFQMLSHRNAMPHMEDVQYNNEEYGTYNLSFSFSDKPGIYTHQDLPACRGPVPPRTTAAPDTSFIPTETLHSSVILSNISTSTKRSSSSPTFQPDTVDVSITHMAHDSAPPKENPGSPNDTSPEELPNTCPSPETHDITITPPLTSPDSQTEQTTNDDPVNSVTSPSSQSSIPCSHTRIASAEIDKPFSKPCVKTPPNPPLWSSSPPKPMSTPKSPPDHSSLKAKLAHIDRSPRDTPQQTLEPTSMALSTDIDQPSTSQDRTDQSDGAADASSPSQDRMPLTNSENTQVCLGVGDAADDGLLRDQNADNNSEDELEPDEEELLRVLARCNPILFTFSK